MAWPIIDGWVIPDDQYKLYEANRLLGTTTESSRRQTP